MLTHALQAILPFVKRTLQALTHDSSARQICTHVDALSPDRTDLSDCGTKDSPRISESISLDHLTGP